MKRQTKKIGSMPSVELLRRSGKSARISKGSMRELVYLSLAPAEDFCGNYVDPDSEIPLDENEVAIIKNLLESRAARLQKLQEAI